MTKPKVLTIYIFLYSLLILPQLTKAQVEIESVELNYLIEEALENNPDYLSVQKNLQSLEAKIPQQGALPDPKLGFALMNLPVNSFEFNQEPMTGKRFSLMQMFPFPGKLGLQKEIAELDFQVGKFYVDEFKNHLIKQIKVNYYQLFLAEQEIDILEKNIELMRQFIKVAEKKYAVGNGLQQDVLKAQVELSRLKDQLITKQQKHEQVVFEINKLINRSMNTEIIISDTIHSQPLEMSTQELIKKAMVNRPLLKAWNHKIEQSRRTVKLAQKSYLPDFSVGVSYTQRDDLANGNRMYDFFSAEIGLNIPLYFNNKQSKKVEQTQLINYSLEDQFMGIKNEVLYQVENIYSNLQKNKKLMMLYKTGIIHQAQQALNSALTGYQVDIVDFLTLLNNQMTLFNYELDYYRVLTDYQKNIAELEFATGTRLK